MAASRMTFFVLGAVDWRLTVCVNAGDALRCVGCCFLAPLPPQAAKMAVRLRYRFSFVLWNRRLLAKFPFMACRHAVEDTKNCGKALGAMV